MITTHKIFIAISFLIFVLTSWAGLIFAADIADPQGYWLSKKKDVVIDIQHCEDELCGYIYWIKEDEQQHDVNNPDKELRGRSMCGIKVLWGMERSASKPQKWKGGRIYKADDGEFFSAQIEMVSDDKMDLRGYIGMPAIGKTSPFSRVNSDDYPACIKSDPIDAQPSSPIQPSGNKNHLNE